MDKLLFVYYRYIYLVFVGLRMRQTGCRRILAGKYMLGCG